MSDTPRMSSRTMSVACLSEARSTMRRARLNASALSSVGRGSPANGEWLSMTATIAPAVPLLGVKFVNSSEFQMARLLEGQARGGGVQKRGANRLVEGHRGGGCAARHRAQQHVAALACPIVPSETSVPPPPRDAA